MLTNLPSTVVVREASLRDGLQSVATIVPIENKLAWLREAYAAGLREIEVGSFVPARLLPQMEGTADVVAEARTLPDLFVSVLVPNLRGAEMAMASGAHMMTVPLSASHAHSLANLRKAPDEVVAEVARIRAARDASGSKTLIEGGVGTAFGCTIQGAVDPAEVMRLVGQLLDAGADRISLADTVGYATPDVVHDLFEQAVRLAGDKFWSAHFHDTRGLGIANVCAAMDVGVTRFDACLGGLGGCPHAPGASGNVSTEDLNYLFTSMGISTGLSMEKLLALRQRIADWLPDETLRGVIWQAGLPKIYPFASTTPAYA